MYNNGFCVSDFACKTVSNEPKCVTGSLHLKDKSICQPGSEKLYYRKCWIQCFGASLILGTSHHSKTELDCSFSLLKLDPYSYSYTGLYQLKINLQHIKAMTVTKHPAQLHNIFAYISQHKVCYVRPTGHLILTCLLSLFYLRR